MFLNSYVSLRAETTTVQYNIELFVE